jgi:hypothetical protein
MEAVNATRQRVWAQQPEGFLEEAVIDGDGTIAGTHGECTGGMALSDKGICVLATEKIPVNDECWATLSGDKFLGVLRGHPEADAVVSLVGPPAWSDEDKVRLPTHRPKFVPVMLVGDPFPVRSLVENGLVDVAILPRARGLPYDKNHPPTTAHEWFDCEYEVVTAKSPRPQN